MRRGAKTHKITLLQWNCRSILPRKDLLCKMLSEHEVDIAALCETWLIPGDSFSIPNYVCYSKPQDTRRRGVLLLVHMSLRSHGLGVFGTADVESVACNVNLGSMTLNIASNYLPPQSEHALTTQECHELFTSLPAPAVYLGDYNAHSDMWGCISADSRSRLMLETMEDERLIVVNDGSITRVAVPPSRPSAIDLTVVSSSLALDVEWEVLNSRGGSDHYPIKTELNLGRNTVTRLKKQRPMDLTKNIDWSEYAARVEQRLDEACGAQSDDVELTFSSLAKLIHSAAVDSQVKPLPDEFAEWTYLQPREWWDAELDVAYRAMIMAEKEFRRLMSSERWQILEEKKSSFQRLRHKKKPESWKRRCEAYDNHTKMSELWKDAKRYRNASQQRDQPMDGVLAEALLDKAAPAFAAQAPQYATLQSQAYTYSHLEEPFQADELELALSEVANTAPGLDGIKFDLLKNLPAGAKSGLLSAYNEVLRQARTPVEWRRARSLFLKKPGRDSSDPNAYRLLCMLSCLRKLMEKMIGLRLDYWANTNDILSKDQHGFRKGRGTQDCLVEFTGLLYVAFEKKQCAVATMLDIEGAYDNVDIDVMCQKLINLRVPKRLVTLLWELLGAKELVYKTEAGEIARTSFKGLPQGSPLSPLLYGIYTQGLREAVGQVQSVIEFADDVTLLVTHKDPMIATQRMQETLIRAVDFYADLGLTVSMSKTTAQMFSRKHSIVTPPLSLNGQSIWNQHVAVRLLGVYFDRKLLWTTDVLNRAMRCKKRMNFLRCLAGTWWGSHPICLKALYESTVRSVLEYASMTVVRTSKTQMLKLQRIQWQALRVSGGFMRSTHTKTMEVLMGEPPLELRMELLNTQFMIGAFGLDKKAVLAVMSELTYLNPNHKFVSEFVRVRQLSVPTAGLNFPYSFPYQSMVGPMEIDDTIRNAITTVSKESRPWFARGIYERAMAQDQDAAQFFSDGSKSAEGTGFGVAGPSGTRVKGHCLEPTTVYTAELQGILQAIRLTDTLSAQDSVYVLTDSMSAVEAIRRPRISARQHHLVYECRNEIAKRQMSKQIKLCWIPSHSGIQGNEEADQLANEGAVTDEPGVIFEPFFRDFSTIAKAWLMQKWQQQWDESDMGRLTYSVRQRVHRTPWYAGLNWNRNAIVFGNRIASNHYRMAAHLNRIEIVGSALCDCGNDYATPDHALYDCELLYRDDILRTLSRIGVPNGMPLRDMMALHMYEAVNEVAVWFQQTKIPI